MPACISPTDPSKDTEKTEDNSSNVSETPKRSDEPTLTDKLNKRLLCSYLRRLNEEDQAAANSGKEKPSDS